MASEIRVNKITHTAGVGTITTNTDGIVVAGIVTANSFVGSGANLTGITQTTINTNADNRIITGSGTANTLNGEANFTYDSDVATLTRSGNDNASGLVIANSNNSQGSAIAQVEIQGGDNASGRLKLECSGQHHTLIEDSVGNLSIDDNGTERLRIDSSGRVGITSIIPASKFTVKGGSIFVGDNNMHGGSAGVIEFGGNSGHFDLKGYSMGGNTTIRMFTSSGGTNAEKFRIDSDGKLYKGGNQFYPLVNYTEVTTYSGSATSSTSYVDLRTIYSSYTPKKAGNRIVIHHQSQMWNGTHGNSNGDVYWKIQRQEGGGSWTDTIKNERILGNHDGHSYTGGNGLARHHRTVHLMGSFICAGTTINLKTQGKSVSGISWDWYHDGNNVLQIWEYDIS